ncbi:MAG: AbrB/MazE/SpoVT family DNA-binding domain-containing protein [Rubrivivax sp.]
MTQALTVDKTGRVLLPSAVRRRLNLQPGSRLALELLAERIELTVLPPESAPTTLSPTGRRVLGASGKPSDAAQTVRDERAAQARGRTGR